MAAHAPILVGLSGLAGSGKSAIAMELCGDEFAFIRVKFADGLKNMLRALLDTAGCPEEDIERHIEGDLKEVPSVYLSGRTPRDVMLTLGTEWGRDMMHPNFWTNIWKRRVRQLMDAGHSVVTDDLRFPNELQALRDLDGVTMRVNRESNVVVRHVSESYELDLDYQIDNTGTLPEAMRQVVEALNI